METERGPSSGRFGEALGLVSRASENARALQRALRTKLRLTKHET